MAWFFLSFIPPLLWGLNTVVDQYLSRRHFMGHPAALQASQGVLTCVSGVVILCIFPPSQWVWAAIALSVLAGVILNTSYVPYMKALQGDDVTLVVALFQLLPVFVFVGEWLFLGGGANLAQTGAALVVILASLALVWDPQIKRFNVRPVLLMAISCIGIATVVLISKSLAGQIHWLHIAAWMGLGAGASSLVIFIQDRRRMIYVASAVKASPAHVMGLSIAQEFLSRSAMALHQYVLLIASSAALVQTVVSGIQPLYVLVLGGVAWMIANDIYDKPDWRGHSLQKLLCIIVMIAGLCGLYQVV